MGDTNNENQNQKHFVLVHGSCHGAWCWFKLIPLLKAAGHRVSALNLSASGTNTKVIHEVTTLHDYTLPLLEFMETIPPEEKVVLVGHSFGGMSISLAMERFPEKISVAIFLAAFMPDSVHKSSYVLDQYVEKTPGEAWIDTQVLPYNNNESDADLTSFLFGPKYLSSTLYHLCSAEDIELGRILVRPASLFLNDLGSVKQYTDERFGSVKRVYVVCDEDRTIKEEFQRWMIHNNQTAETKELKGVDHMPMISDPKQVSLCILEIALAYS
uniref:salicylic acid-binding protein 2-like n=1 Tax=Erigeron canadensis TaxID=72917 RepID=UPI001CB9BEE9|nr:salicylic acid-binding protein 2-like [Erigeron canadensis]